MAPAHIRIHINDKGKRVNIHHIDGFQSRNTVMDTMARRAIPLIDESVFAGSGGDGDGDGDVEIILEVYTGDAPTEGAVTPRAIYMSDTREKAIHCAPCHVCLSWPEIGMPRTMEMIAAINNSGQAPWIVPKLFWIGADTHPNRQILVQLARDHSERIEARMMFWNHRIQPSTFVSLPDHAKYKYLIDVEGNGYSGRLKLFLWSRRLIFVPDRPWWDYVTAMLEPWVHYVPVARDMSDLLERLDWADSHEEEVKKIIENAYTFAQEHVTEDAAIRHFAKVITHHIGKTASTSTIQQSSALPAAPAPRRKIL